MKQEISITPIKRATGASQPLEGIYRLKGNIVNILTDGSVISKECSPGQLTKKIVFDDHNISLDIEWDSEKDGKIPNEVNAWQQHPLIKNPKNQHLLTPVFEMVNKFEKIKVDVSKIKEMGAVFNIISDMLEEQVRDIAFFWGHNPTHESPEETFFELVDFKSGKLMTGNNPSKFLKTRKTADFEHIVIVKKAIIYGVVEKRAEQFIINDEIIGSAIEDVIAYCKANTKQYDFIKKEVKKLDGLPLDVDLKKPVEEILEDLKGKPEGSTVPEPDEPEEVNEEEFLLQLRATAKGLGISHAHTMKKETLIVRIEEAKVEKGIYSEKEYA